MPSRASDFSPELHRTLRLFQFVALLGLGYSIAALAGGTASKADWMQLLYTTWFALSLISAEAILCCIRAGVVTLGLSTLVVAVVEIATGSASLGGASLGLLILYLIVAYVRPAWDCFD